jgi:hypothetical protein
MSWCGWVPSSESERFQSFSPYMNGPESITALVYGPESITALGPTYLDRHGDGSTDRPLLIASCGCFKL